MKNIDNLMYFLLAIVIMFILYYFVNVYNKLIHSYESVNNGKSLIDVYLKKRYDLIPNLVECAKGYIKYEKEILNEIAKLRANFTNNINEQDANKLNEYYQNIILTLEKYPEIKAGENFLKLQKELTNVENEISAARRIYSVAIMKYNNYVQQFPSNIFAKIYGYKKVSPLKFEVEDIKVKF